MTRNEKLVVAAIAFSLLPIWTSGLREGMNFIGWTINHTIWGPPSEYIPDEYYLPDQPVPLEF